jgi:acyl carrier protein
MSEIVVDRLRKVFSRVLGVSIGNINETIETSNTPEWDSLRHLELCMAIELEFNRKMSIDEISESHSFIAFVRLLSPT